LSIRTRLLLLTLGLLVPLVLVGLYNQSDAWSTSRELLNRSMEHQAKLAATAFEQWVGAQRQTLLTVSDLARTGTANNAALREYLNSVVKTRPTWLNVEIVDPAGEVVLSQTAKKWNLEATPLTNLKARLDESRSLVIATEQISDKQLRLLTMAMPLADGNFVVARIDGTSASDVFKQLELPEDHIIAVFDPNGRLIFRSQISPEQLSLDVSQTPLLTALSGKRTGVIEVESPYDKIDRVYGLARIDSVDAVVAVGLPRDDLYGGAQQQLRQQVLLGLLIACLAVFAAFFIARGIAEPLRRLTVAAKAFGEGELSVRSGVEDDPAVRELGMTFNQMARKIEAREEKLKELDQLKSEFVSSVSHELRTPLTTIKTLIRLLQRSSLPEDTREEYLETIAGECDRQIDLVQNLLDLTRLESGSYHPVMEDIDPAETIDSVVGLHRNFADSRAIRLQLFTPPEPLPNVRTDRTALYRILSGLIENALKYTPEFGSVKVIAGRVDGDLVIEVQDNGCGIAKEDLGRIFEKFYRGRPLSISAIGATRNGSTPDVLFNADPIPGMGLGLYIVKALVDQVGGEIDVKSPVAGGAGTAFIVRLPASTKRPRLEQLTEQQHPHDEQEQMDHRPADPKREAQ
jgi:signal transduction histidine kinase